MLFLSFGFFLLLQQQLSTVLAFVPPSTSEPGQPQLPARRKFSSAAPPFSFPTSLTDDSWRRLPIFPSSSSSLSSSTTATSTPTSNRICRARDLLQGLVEDELCYTTEAGARQFGEACDVNVVYEDRFEPQPVIGKIDVTNHMLAKVQQRQGKGGFRMDRISDGDAACGFAWTWTCDDQEGLRGTTFVELNERGLIQYVSEIPEPIYKPGDQTKDLLRFVTSDAEWKPFAPIPEPKPTPTAAHELAKYLYIDLQNADPDEGIEELMRFLNDDIVYRDFNYEDVLRGPAQVREFVEKFRFPGIEFRPLKFDDGVDSTCFTWEVVLMDAPDTVKGMSYYELDPDSRKIRYVRDVPESAIKPPILGKLARQFRPGLGVFQGSPIHSRPGGM